MRRNLVGRQLYQIFEKSLMILALVTDSSILFGVTFCAIYLPIVRIVHVFQLHIRGQASLLRRALIHGLLPRVQLLLVWLLS